MTETLSVAVPDGTTDKLDRLARATGRPVPDHVADAMTAHLERELAVIESIQRSLAEMRDGQVTPHDEVMAEVDEAIARAGEARSTA